MKSIPCKKNGDVNTNSIYDQYMCCVTIVDLLSDIIWIRRLIVCLIYYDMDVSNTVKYEESVLDIKLSWWRDRPTRSNILTITAIDLVYIIIPIIKTTVCITQLNPIYYEFR